MSRVHLIYPHGVSIACPDAIGRKLGEHLREHFDVVQYDWDEPGVITPTPGDILLGHPHPAPWTIFRRSARQSGWGRVIVLAPFSPGDPRQPAFMHRILRRCDLYLAITGNYWFEQTPHSLFSHWLPKLRHVDLAVDRSDFPVIKQQFNPAGRRRFLYIGHTAWYKNTGYLTELARLLPGTEISWIGKGDRTIEGLTALGARDFSTPGGRASIAEHDFLLTVGNADANPTTVLEAMAWGLVPVCTRQSGYEGYPGIINLPLGNPAAAAGILSALQHCPESRLLDFQRQNWNLLDAHFNWRRFATQVHEALESPVGRSGCSGGLAREVRVRAAELKSLIVFRGNLKTAAAHLLRSELRRDRLPGATEEHPA